MNEQDRHLYAMPLRELAASMKWDEKEIREKLAKDHELPLPNSYAPVPPGKVRELFESRDIPYHSKTISFINLKGGVGKTVSAANTATRAIQYGYNVCMVDMDMQASLTLLFGAVPGDEEPIFFDVWQDPDRMALASITQLNDHLGILPSSLENGLLDSSLSKPASQKNAVKGVCKVLKGDRFDLVVIDCPPSLGTAVISSICAADIVVIPLGNDSFSLKGLKLTLQEIESICTTFGLPMPEIKVLFTGFDKRQKMTHDIYEAVSTDYQQYLAPNVIRTSSEFSKAIARGETVFASSRKSPAKEDYDRFVKHVLKLDKN
jgi:chromosome partitioning protein